MKERAAGVVVFLSLLVVSSWVVYFLVENLEFFSPKEKYHLRLDIDHGVPEALDRLDELVEQRKAPWVGPRIQAAWLTRWGEVLTEETSILNLSPNLAWTQLAAMGLVFIVLLAPQLDQPRHKRRRDRR